MDDDPVEAGLAAFFPHAAWRLAATSLPVRDPEASAAFYVRVLGLRRLAHDAIDGVVSSVTLFAGDFELVLVRADAFPSLSLALYVDDVEAAAETARELGATVIAEGTTDLAARSDYAWYATLRDPDGHVITLMEITAEWQAAEPA